MFVEFLLFASGLYLFYFIIINKNLYVLVSRYNVSPIDKKLTFTIKQNYIHIILNAQVNFRFFFNMMLAAATAACQRYLLTPFDIFFSSL